MSDSLRTIGVAMGALGGGAVVVMRVLAVGAWKQRLEAAVAANQAAIERVASDVAELKAMLTPAEEARRIAEDAEKSPGS